MSSAARAAIALAALTIGVTTAGCWPGRCAGGFRKLWPTSLLTGAGEVPTVDARTVFILNSDSSQRPAAELLSRSRIDDSSFFVERLGDGVGPTATAGERVAATIEATPISSAHSCASAATFTLRPAAPLAPGEYAAVVLLDRATWPAIDDGAVTMYQGHPALVRRVRVAE